MEDCLTSTSAPTRQSHQVSMQRAMLYSSLRFRTQNSIPMEYGIFSELREMGMGGRGREPGSLSPPHAGTHIEVS